MIYDLVPALFIGLASTIESSQCELIANAKLEAVLRNKKTLDMAKMIKNDMAAWMIVAPENMKALVNSLVNQRIEIKGKQVD
jgi:hypothetical protein